MSNQDDRKTKYRKISAEINNEFFELVDKKAHELRISKSELIRRALAEYLNA